MELVQAVDEEILAGAPWSGRLCGLYENAANVRTEKGGLISLVARRFFPGPGRIVLADAAPLRRLRSDEALCLSSGRLVSAAGRFSLDLSRASLWHERQLCGRLSENFASRWYRAAEMILGACRKEEARFFECLVSDGKREETQDPVYAKIIRVMKPVQSGGSAAVFGRAVRELVGLGYGLTPSADDFFCGFLQALTLLRRFSGKDFRFEEFFVQGGRQLSCCRDRTPFVSFHFLKWAFAGRFPQEVFCFFSAMNAGREPELRRLTEIFFSYGHSSGREILFGFMTAVKLWLVSA